jgi:addiction module RelE/StbE family toxin
MRLVWTERAVRELAGIRVYIRRDNAAAADRQVERVLVAVSTLARFPEMGRPGRRSGTRELSVARTRYIVAYRIRNDTIEVLAVLHERQRWPEGF